MRTPSHEIITAVPVSFTDDGALDLDGTREILRYVAGSGVQGALVLGTTGEFPALSIPERNAVAALAVQVLHGIRVIVHVGAASRYEVSQLIEGARASGAREIAILTPFYLPAPPDEVFAFFRDATAEADGLDVHLYLFEARTGVRVDVELLVRLAQLPNVVGVKVSGEPLDRIPLYRARLPEGFRIYTGSDREFAAAIAAGADGVISGVASAFAKPFVEMRAALQRADTEAVANLQNDVDEAVAAICGEPTRMRAVHRLAGRPVGRSRMPIPEPGPEELQRLARALPQFH
ncbi:4-hydroxy-tetrahydrodipicolinate synthase [Micromonospora pallida]|uniref:4-hydroxy-tetrahydrodipicolinate synthase n=1 Tax=Micromonospora pallida TaxID=145854 RepID=A0A1C6SFL8_9ACTN|nr:dihydrodipicolinate synthase family protein [Micromonospora pallida]SCL28280.1 4-hydroxy-tetrahydrodipicolinate synthase [Micromonospora pallida]